MFYDNLFCAAEGNGNWMLGSKEGMNQIFAWVFSDWSTCREGCVVLLWLASADWFGCLSLYVTLKCILNSSAWNGRLYPSNKFHFLRIGMVAYGLTYLPASSWCLLLKTCFAVARMKYTVHKAVLRWVHSSFGVVTACRWKWLSFWSHDIISW